MLSHIYPAKDRNLWWLQLRIANGRLASFFWLVIRPYTNGKSKTWRLSAMAAAKTGAGLKPFKVRLFGADLDDNFDVIINLNIFIEIKVLQQQYRHWHHSVLVSCFKNPPHLNIRAHCISTQCCGVTKGL